MDFGSVARGEENATSDVDIAVDLAPEAGLSLTGFARLRLDLTDILGRTADLTEWVISPRTGNPDVESLVHPRTINGSRLVASICRVSASFLAFAAA